MDGQLIRCLLFPVHLLRLSPVHELPATTKAVERWPRNCCPLREVRHSYLSYKNAKWNSFQEYSTVQSKLPMAVTLFAISVACCDCVLAPLKYLCDQYNFTFVWTWSLRVHTTHQRRRRRHIHYIINQPLTRAPFLSPSQQPGIYVHTEINRDTNQILRPNTNCRTPSTPSSVKIFLSWSTGEYYYY